MNPTELKRFKELELLHKAGKICFLKTQDTFTLFYRTVHLADYTPDFTYMENGEYIAEEVKGSKSQHSATRRDYVLRVKWFLAIYPNYRFFEVIGNKRTEYKLVVNKSGKSILRAVK